MARTGHLDDVRRGSITVFDDPLSIAAAVLGGAAGIALMIRLGGFRGLPSASMPTAESRPRPTGYARTDAPTASPILTAIGAAVTGVGLALGSSTGVLSWLLIGLGGLLLAGAAWRWLRGPRAAVGGGEAAGDGGSDGDRAD